MPAVSWNQFRPSRLKSCWTTNGGQDLKSNCTTESYDGGDPSSAADLKTSIVDRDGNLREGLCHDGDLKTSLTGGTASATPQELSQELLQWS